MSEQKIPKRELSDDAVHEWFGLSYAAYAVLPRSILQSMPTEWQKRFITLMEEIEEHEELHCPKEGTYTVYLRGENGRFIQDFFRDYERGRRMLIPSGKFKLENECPYCGSNKTYEQNGSRKDMWSCRYCGREFKKE